MAKGQSFLKQWGSRFKTEWINDAALKNYYFAYARTDALIDDLKAKRAETEKPGTLSPKGVTEAVRKYAAEKIIPELRREKHRLEVSLARVGDRRKQLATPKIDNKDVVAAMQRQEVRRVLREMPDAARNQHMLNNPDELTRAAVYEAPAFMTQIPDEIRARAEEAYLQTKHPEAIKRLADETEVIETVEAAIRTALKDVQVETDFTNDQRGFDIWGEAASAAVEAELGKKPGKGAISVDPAIVLADLKSLGVEDRNSVMQSFAADPQMLSEAIDTAVDAVLAGAA